MNAMPPTARPNARQPRARLAARIAACVLCCGPLAAGAAGTGDGEPGQLSLEQLLDLDVQSASKFVQKASEAPSSVTVVTSADIRRYGYRRLGDVLNSVAGLYVHYDRNYEYLGVRGFGPLGSYNSRVLVMVDGYRLNDPVYGQGSIGLEFPVDVDLIERVEFVPGPGSAIYGSNAFLGVVNVITRNGRSFGGGEASVEAGSWGTYKGRASYGRRFANDLDLLVSVSGVTSRGRDLYFREFDAPGVGDGVARALDYERAPSVFAKLAWHGFTLEAAEGTRTKGVPTASFQSVFNDPRESTRDRQSLVELRYDGSMATDLDVAVRVNRGSYDYRGHYPYASADGASTILNVDRARSSWWGSEVKLISRAFKGHKLVFGAEYVDNTRKEQFNYDLQPPATYLDERHRSSQSGVYLQDQIALGRSLVLNAGVRHDRYSTFGSITNPRLALIYSATPSLTLKALYGKAYRAPNDGELFFSSQPLGWKSNPGLKPERIATQELVAEWRLSSLTRVTLSAFRYHISELVTLTSDPADGLQVYRNNGAATVHGAQAEVERLWRDGTALRASYSYQQARDDEDNAATQGVNAGRLVNSPRHLAKLDASMLLPGSGDALRGGLAVRYVGSRLTRSAATVGGYATANLTLSSERSFAGGLWSLGVYNLFDHRYADPASDAHVQDTIVQDGRSLRLKYTVRF